MKTIYLFDPNTHIYCGCIPAKKRNVDGAGQVLDVLSSTEIAVIAEKNGYQRYFEDEAWCYIVDNRSKNYWDADGTKHKIKEIGEAVPEDALLEAPISPPTIEQLSNDARVKRDSLLNDLSKRYDRYASETRLIMDTTDSIEALDICAQALRDITTQRGFPTTIEWPVVPA